MRRPPTAETAEPAGSAILTQLDPDQRAAAETVRGPLLIVAGPGTGKTRTLTHRIAHLVADHGISPEQCLAITFSRRAAQEMKERLAQLLPESGLRIPVLTFHALGLLILQEQAARLDMPPDFRVADDRERSRLMVENAGLSERQARPPAGGDLARQTDWRCRRGVRRDGRLARGVWAADAAAIVGRL